MDLPHECSSQDALKTLREDFDFATVLMKSAALKNIASFTFAGLRIPAILKDSSEQWNANLSGKTALEIVIFQDHLHDRIALLAKNNRLVREIWGFNDRTRTYREFELSAGETAPLAIELTVGLIEALNRRSWPEVSLALERKLRWRIDRIDSYLTKGVNFRDPEV